MGISRPSMGGESPDADADGDEDEGQAVAVNEDDIPDIDGRSDDDDWAEDMSPEAVAAREKELASQLKNSMILGEQGGDEDEDEDEDSPYYQLKVWVQEERGKADVKSVFAKVKELGIEKKHKAVLVLSEWLFTEDAVKQIPKYSTLFATVSPAFQLFFPSQAGKDLTLPALSPSCADCHVGEAPEGPPRRCRAPGWHSLPRPDQGRAQAPDGLLSG